MASQDKGKAPMLKEGENSDTIPKNYRDALAFLVRLKGLIGQNFGEFCQHLYEFMDKRTYRQTFCLKASLLLIEHSNLVTEIHHDLGSIVDWDPNLLERFRADLLMICLGSAPTERTGSGITATENTSIQSHSNPAIQEFLNILNKPRQQVVELEEEPSTNFLSMMNSDIPTISVPVAVQENVSRGDENQSREVQEHESSLGREFWQLQQQYAQQYTQQWQQQLRNEHLSQEIQERELTQKEPDTSSVPVAMQQNVSRGKQHLNRKIQEQELPKRRKYWRRLQLHDETATIAKCDTKTKPMTPEQMRYRLQQIYEQQQQQQQVEAHRQQQSYRQYRMQQQYAQQQQQLTPQESDMQYRHRLHAQQQQQTQTQQQSCVQPWQYPPQQWYVQQQQSYVQLRDMQQWYMQPHLYGQQQDSQRQQPQQTGQQQEEHNPDRNTSQRKHNPDRNTSQRTERD